MTPRLGKRIHENFNIIDSPIIGICKIIIVFICYGTIVA